MTYNQLKKKQENEMNEFPMKFAFSSKQFDQGMSELGLNPEDKHLVCSIGNGGFIRKTDSQAFGDMLYAHQEEHKRAIADDKSGDGYVYDMFLYELNNYEYSITLDAEQALTSLGLTEEDVRQDKVLTKAFIKACQQAKKVS